MKNRPLVICEAIPFGYGPAAILHSIIDKMMQDFEIIIISSGSTYDYFYKLNYHCIQCSSYDKDEMKSILNKIEKIDFILSVENERIIEVGQSLNIKTAYVNVFEFIWPLNTNYLLNSDLHIVYSLFESKEQLSIVTKKSKSIFILKPDIVKSNFSTDKKGILVHLGGLNSNCISEKHQFIYAEIIITVLNNIFQKNETIKIVTNDVLRAYLFEKYSHLENMTFHTLNSIDFLKILSSSKHYFTTPGIYSTLQGFYEKSITHLLLPANFTQIHQLDGFNKMSKIKYPTFEDLFGKENFILSTNEKEGLNQISTKLVTVCTDNSILNKYITLLKSIINRISTEDRIKDQEQIEASLVPNTHKLVELLKAMALNSH